MKAQKGMRKRKEKTIFRSLFVPLLIWILFQTTVFYVAATYGGIGASLEQNARDIFTERLLNRTNEIQSEYNRHWTDLSRCETTLNSMYASYLRDNEKEALLEDQDQVAYLTQAADVLIQTLRQNGTNSVFLILYDGAQGEVSAGSHSYYGLNFRDLEPTNTYTDREDILIEISPYSVMDSTGISLDSRWESRYTFESLEAGDYFYHPLQAAWGNPDADSSSLAYISDLHQLYPTDLTMFSYSIPLTSNGVTYGVLGVEITTRYMCSLLPGSELSSDNSGCYLLGLKEDGSDQYTILAGAGNLYNRCFESETTISCREDQVTGFSLTGRGDLKLFAVKDALQVYDNNNPFEDRELALFAVIEEASIYGYSRNVGNMILGLSIFTFLVGIIFIIVVSRRFADPINRLAKKVQAADTSAGFHLGRLGIMEVDTLVESIENLNHDVSTNIARTEFFSRMSHDMRTPMNAIIGFSSPEVLRTATMKEKDEYLAKIQDSSVYLLGLINEVLDITKVSQHKNILNMSNCHVEKLWTSVLPMIEKLAEEKSIHFNVNIKNAADDLCVVADVQHFEQILMNLLSNAVKFTPTGGMVNLNIDIRTDENNQAKLSISVSDTGIGMSDSFMEKLYTPFEQENHGKEGTGLGLSIAKSLVEEMGGEIQCYSEKNVGTTFEIYISFDICDASQVEEEKVPENVDHILKKKRVLLCEDHPMNQMLARRLLENKEMLVDIAENGKRGVEEFAESPRNFYDVILMDVRMPVMGGLEAAKAIRQLPRDEAKTIPIIAMTANAFEEDKKMSRAAGMNDHLAKPIDPSLLYATLAKFLREDHKDEPGHKA